MKNWKMVLFLSCINFLFLFYATPVYAANDNIVPNPSLEVVSGDDASLPLSWISEQYGNNTTVFSYLNTGYLGTKSVKVDIAAYVDGDAHYKYEQQSVDPGKEYEFSVYYKSNTYTEVYAEVILASGEYSYLYLGSVVPSATWNKFVARAVMPLDAITATVYVTVASLGYLITDNYSLALTDLPVGLNRALVTLTYDETAKTVYTYGFPLFKKYGIAGDIYITSNQLGISGMMTKYQLNRFKTLGFEMGSHSVTHPSLTLLGNVRLNTELRRSQLSISNYFGGIAVPSFASPYGEYNIKVITYIKKYYQSHRTTDVGFNSLDSFDPYMIKAFSIESDMTADYVKGLIDQAIKDKTWLVLVYHDIRPDDGTGFLWTTTPANMEAVLSYLKTNNVATVTTTQAVNEIKAQQ